MDTQRRHPLTALNTALHRQATEAEGDSAAGSGSSSGSGCRWRRCQADSRRACGDFLSWLPEWLLPEDVVTFKQPTRAAEPAVTGETEDEFQFKPAPRADSRAAASECSAESGQVRGSASESSQRRDVDDSVDSAGQPAFAGSPLKAAFADTGSQPATADAYGANGMEAAIAGNWAKPATAEDAFGANGMEAAIADNFAQFPDAAAAQGLGPCACGHEWHEEADADFCRKCGTKKPETGDSTEAQNSLHSK